MKTVDMMDPMARESLAMRIARLTLELGAVRDELGRAGVRPFDAGRSLVDLEPRAFEVIDLDADGVQRALFAIAERLDRDLAAKV
jgi:hypothetical protein